MERFIEIADFYIFEIAELYIFEIAELYIFDKVKILRLFFEVFGNSEQLKFKPVGISDKLKF